MELKIYTVNPDYINKLHEVDNKVLLEHTEGHKRTFLGVVLKFNEKFYCIPFSSPDSADYLDKSTNKIRRSFYPVILRMFEVEHGKRKFYGKLLFNNMIPVCQSVIDVYDLENEEDLAYRTLVQKQFSIIRKEYASGNIDKYCKKIYSDKLNNKSEGYIRATVDFLKLEAACRQWTFDSLSIELIKSQELFYVKNEKDIKSLINIKNGVFSRITGFNKNNSDLQQISIFAKDEFGQEKSINIIVKMNTTSKVIS